MESKSLQRVRRNETEWRAILERQAQSGMTVGRFCEAEGISSGCFYQWRRRLSHAPAATFLELSPELLGRGRVRAEVDLGQGLIVRIFG